MVTKSSSSSKACPQQASLQYKGGPRLQGSSWYVTSAVVKNDLAQLVLVELLQVSGVHLVRLVKCVDAVALQDTPPAAKRRELFST